MACLALAFLSVSASTYRIHYNHYSRPLGIVPSVFSFLLTCFIFQRAVVLPSFIATFLVWSSPCFVADTVPNWLSLKTLPDPVPTTGLASRFERISSALSDRLFIYTWFWETFGVCFLRFSIYLLSRDGLEERRELSGSISGLHIHT